MFSITPVYIYYYIYLQKYFESSVFIVEDVILTSCKIRKVVRFFFENGNFYKIEKELKTHLKCFKIFCSFLLHERKMD